MPFRVLFLAAGFCGVVSSALAQLTSVDVQRIITQSVLRASKIAPDSIIAVTDREGYVLAVWVVRGGEPTILERAIAVGKAGTAAFLSSNANAFTSRTAAFIIQQHFPPGIRNLPPGPLVGVGFSNLPFSDVNRFKMTDLVQSSTSPGTRGSPIPLTSLNGIPGGVPLFKNGVLVGGIGVTGGGIVIDPADGIGRSASGIEFPPTFFVRGPTLDEDIALAGQKGFAPPSNILADDVFINGISLPYVESTAGSTAGGRFTGNSAIAFPIQSPPPPFPYPRATMGGVEGQIRQRIINDPIPGTINGEARLTADEVRAMLAAAADRVRTTRAGIRLPIGTRMEVFIVVVNNPNIPRVGPTVLGTFRTGDATLFSWDVAAQKARTAVGFSSNTSAFSTRTVGFLAQSDYPPGIDPESPGPLNGIQEEFSGFVRAALPILEPTAALLSPPFAPNPMFPNGITIFPGGFPIYRNGQLIGAVGISGDGVDQDDIVGASGSSVFPAPFEIRADQFHFDGTRLPYAKFPRDPEGINRITPVVLPTMAAASTAASSELGNISIRLAVDSGEKLMIGGFIITGVVPKTVVLRALGPSLAGAGVGNALADPVLELFDETGASVAQNINWKDAQEEELMATGLTPSSDLESAIVQTLPPGAYTASVTGQDGGGGVGLLEIYDLDPSPASRLANLSARGMVGTQDDVMIGGFIVRGGTSGRKVMVRGVGPSLRASGVGEALPDPTLEVRDGNGEMMAANDNWWETQAGEIHGFSLAPGNDLEAAAMLTLSPGAYTAMLKGTGGCTGVAVLEVYKLE